MNFTLDTAATTSVMAERVAKQYNFKILQSNVEVKLAHNEIVKVIGITERLEVDVKGRKCTMEFSFFLAQNHKKSKGGNQDNLYY